MSIIDDVMESYRAQAMGAGMIAIDRAGNQPGSAAATSQQITSTAVFEPAKYGDIIQQNPVLPAGVDVLVLPRPTITRTFLFIQNTTAGIIYFAFGQQANLQSGQIQAGGNLFMDAFVPQNDVHLYAPVLSSIPLLYSNVNLGG